MNKIFLCLLFFVLCYGAAAGMQFSEPPAGNDEWGFRPAGGETVKTTPAPFVWRNQPGATAYELQYAADPEFRSPVTAGNLRWNAWCPAEVMAPGVWYWRVRYRNGQGAVSGWSSVRRFEITADASANPMPERREWEKKIPVTHPRLFIRPEQLPALRAACRERLKPGFDDLVRQCDALVATPPPTAEPPLYPAGVERPSPEWMKIWWGNREYVIKALDGAAVLGFGWRLTGNEVYGAAARRILLECAKWDPEGATNRRYNDEAGMPYLYLFSRAYTYCHGLLSEPERELCRKVARQRGNEAFRVLYPNHFYRPYDSHRNRLWHFLGEAGIAFYREIPEAADWIGAALLTYFCVYPVWGDDDGGWHEGLLYWQQYIDRFFWWGDIMRDTFGIEPARKPFFNRTGFYPMYLLPPNTRDGGFGDLSEFGRKQHALSMKNLASLTGNGYVQWYADAVGPAPKESAYLELARAVRPAVKPRPPSDLPSSRLFRGNGLALLNTNLVNGRENVQIHFKSSPVGTWSHGYDANNSFLLNAFGERLLIRSGRRDMYASNFHSNWMWETKSENNLTFDGIGQKKHSRDAKGEVRRFVNGTRFDYVEGEAAGSYEGRLTGFRRRILFCKPSAILITDTLEAPKKGTFQWHMHARNPFEIKDQHDIRVRSNHAGARIEMLFPEKLELNITDRFTPPLPEHIKLVQHHLTAVPPEQSDRALFITLIRPYRVGHAPEKSAVMTGNGSDFRIEVVLPEGVLRCFVDRETGEITAELGDESFQ